MNRVGLRIGLSLMRSLPQINWKGAIVRLAAESLESPSKTASAAAIGVFFGIAPFWGFQLALALLAATVLRVNRVIAGAASNISIPPMIPFIIYASLKTGGLALGRSMSPDFSLNSANLQLVKNYAAQYLVGSVLLAFICALAAWTLVYSFSLAYARKKEAALNKQ